MLYPCGVSGPLDYDRWKCREFVHRALQRIEEDQLPLFWYYLAFNCHAALSLLREDTEDVQQLRCEWTDMRPRERQDVLDHFVLVMERVAKEAAANVMRTVPLPRKEDKDDDPE